MEPERLRRVEIDQDLLEEYPFLKQGFPVKHRAVQPQNSYSSKENNEFYKEKTNDFENCNSDGFLQILKGTVFKQFVQP